MTTSILLPNFDSRYDQKIIDKRFIPKIKYDNQEYYTFGKENYEINNNFEKIDENNDVNKISYLFPSIPIKVS